MIGTLVLLLHLGLVLANPPRIQIPRQRTIHIPYPVDRPVPVPVPVTRRIYVPSPPQHVPTYIHHVVAPQPRIIVYRHPVHGTTGWYPQSGVSGAIPMGGLPSRQVFGQDINVFGGIGHSTYPVGLGHGHMRTGFHGQGGTPFGQGGFGGIYNSAYNIGGGFRGVSLGPSMTTGGAAMGGVGMGGDILVGGGVRGTVGVGMGGGNLIGGGVRGTVGGGMGGGNLVSGGTGGSGGGFIGTNTNAFNLALARSMIQSGNTGGVAPNNGIFRVVHNAIRFLGNGANTGARSGGADSGGEREFEGSTGTLGGLIRGFAGSTVGGHSSTSGSSSSGGGGGGGGGGGSDGGGDSNGNGYYRSFWSHFEDDDDD